MSRRLRAKVDDYKRPEDYDPDTQRRLMAIMFARNGHLVTACESLGVKLNRNDRNKVNSIPKARHPKFRTWPEFEEFLTEVEQIATQLETIGL